MNIEILKIASNTKNNKKIKNFTHKSKHKNPLCGDEMEISLIVKNQKISEIGYQCKSCIYCQASASLVSRKMINKTIEDISEIVQLAKLFFNGTEKNLSKKLSAFKDIIKYENLKRKQCILLPFDTLLKAIKK